MDTKFNKPTNQNSLKVAKVVKQMNKRIRKRYYKSLGTCMINSPLSTFSAQKYKHTNKQTHTHTHKVTHIHTHTHTHTHIDRFSETH